MPVYTYRCNSCGTQFEKHQPFHDAPLKNCPKCRKKALQKVITPSKVIFKGSGFYATDNKAPSRDKSSSGDKSPSGEKSSSGDKSSSADKPPSGEKSSEKSSTETKSEKKSESKASESKSSEKSE